MTVLRPLKIAPGFSAQQWGQLTLDPDAPAAADWQVAIAILEGRIRARFFDPIDALMGLEDNRPEKSFGFTILAIDCLVIETLQAFREGVINHDGKSKKLFTSFLKGWAAFKDCVPKGADMGALAKRVYKDCRCALLHSGATSGQLRVSASGPTFEFNDGHVERINRTSLHQSLKGAFEQYVVDLRAAEGGDLRHKFKAKMHATCGGG